jgi:hypothetical protein
MSEQNAPSNPSNGKAVASMVLGIIGAVCIVFGVYAFIGMIVSIIGLVLGISAKKQSPSGMATAGIVLSIIALALCAITVISCLACVGCIASSVPWAAIR